MTRSSHPALLPTRSSTNGTFVNGKAIGKNAECALRIGDKITFSKAREGGVGLYNIDHTPVTLAHSLALPAWVHAPVRARFPSSTAHPGEFHARRCTTTPSRG